MTDSELIAGILEGNRLAGEALVDRFEAPLVRYLTVALPIPDLARDGAQEVFLRLIQAIRSGKLANVGSLTALIFTIARRLAIDAGRQWSRRPIMRSIDEAINPEGGSLAEIVPDTAPDAREVAASRERDLQVQAALRELDDETRSVITLRHIDGLSSKEVAETLGLPEGTVWSRLHRGLEALRKRLAARPATDKSSNIRSPRP